MTTIIIGDIKLNLADLAHSCSVSQEWIVERVQAGLLCTLPMNADKASYSSAELTRARRLLNIERSFDANPELAALVVDMMEEIERLRGQVSRIDNDLIDL
ncbi:chaperone modulator CbpM [Sulfuriferula thiophila]|uniref:chaperone modulator CbpM n=1 Tax=Sulfuriferula thiophila TaxID=1781211 RepID=UPI000F615D35|nr:chaperone modulator CbpM [Sulfuriferula thiophila]